jgi:predicted nucleic acid-binding protein
LLVAALEQRFTLLFSVALMVEYEAMIRSQHLVASKLSAQDVGILLDAVASVGEPACPAYLWRPSLRDADDDMVLEVAVAPSHATRLRTLVALLMSKDFEPKAVDLAIAYLGEELAEREQARRLLRHHGISDDAINAQAAELHPQSIPALTA